MPEANTTCKVCGSNFYAKPNWLEKGWSKYCSNECRYESQKNGKTFECEICEEEVYRSKRMIKRSKSNKFFCSKSCQTEWRNKKFTEKNHSNWKHGKHSYRRKMKKSDRDMICKKCGEEDKRVLVVHHIDHNKENNKLDNLVWLCCNCHHLIHNNEKEEEKFKQKLDGERSSVVER